MSQEVSLLELREAVQLYEQEEEHLNLSYTWYLAEASRFGRIYFARIPVPTHKHNNTWYVEQEKFMEAIEHHRKSLENRREVADSFSRGIVNGQAGQTVEGDEVTYKVLGDFCLVRTEEDWWIGNTFGNWYCNKCQTPAKTEHEKEECQFCKYGKGCGGDCTLSQLYCPNCGNTLDL